MRRMLIALPLLLAGCVQDIARSRVQSALVGAGLSAPVSSCMAGHMVDKLSIAQLRKLEALRGVGRSPLDYAMAVRRIDDPDVIRVTVAAAGLCLSGWEH